MRKPLILLLMAVAAPFAMADAVYNYTGPVYTSASNATLCGPRPCADYTGKNATMSITTRLPVQPSTSAVLYPADIVSFSFSDGVFTYTNSDPDVRFEAFSLTTDAQGKATAGGGTIYKWLSGATPHAVGDIYRYMTFGPGSPVSVGNNIGAGGASATDFPAGGVFNLAESSYGSAPDGAGSWTSALPAPSVTTVTPNTGSTAGGADVMLSGANFLNGATVTVGGVPATLVTWVSATELWVRVPAGSLGAKNVVLTNPDTQSATLVGGFTYVAPVAKPTSVPTLSEYGMMVLVTLMAMFGLRAAGRPNGR